MGASGRKSLTGKAILIAGPTASGKSALALRIAQQVGGSIINADSMQVYQDARILTARPSPADEAAAPHHLYGFVPGSEAYSAGRYVIDAAAAIRRVREEGRVPIVAGGTGLYFTALLQGLSAIPPVDAAVRRHWRGEAGRLGAAALHKALTLRDPRMAARLARNDAQRIVRALEVLETTGRSLADWHAMPGTGPLATDACIKLVVSPPRTVLYERCNARFEAMLRAGALQEAAALRDARLSPDLPLMRAVGLRPLMAYLDGRSTLAEAKAQAQAETRQYAKRQLTWLKSNMIAWKQLDTKEMEREGFDFLS